MHLKVGDDLHGIVYGGQILLVPCTCPLDPGRMPEIKLPAPAAACCPVALNWAPPKKRY